MTERVRFAAILLAGGRSSRMGRPKAWLDCGGEPMLARTARTLARVCSPLVVVGAPGQDLPPLPVDAIHVADPVEGRGPLQGLAAGLAALADAGAEAAYLSSCDVPLLRADFVQMMMERLADADIAVAVEDGFHHPMAAVYRVGTVRPEVEALLAADRLRPFFLFERVRTVLVPTAELRRADPALDSLRNCNTPEDYEALLARLAALDDTDAGGVA